MEIDQTFTAIPWIQDLSSQKKTAYCIYLYLQLVFQALFIPFSDNVNSELLREINNKTKKILNLPKNENKSSNNQPKSITHARSMSDPSLNMPCFVVDLFILWFLYSQYNSLTQNALYKLCHQFNLLKQTLKWGFIGGLTVLGGVSIVSTGGIAIPAVASITGIITGVFGGAAGIGFKDNYIQPKNDIPLIESQIEGLDFFQHYICISGFINDDLSYPVTWGCHSWFNTLFTNINQIILKWESLLLSSFDKNLETLNKETVIFNNELSELKPVVLDMMKSKLVIDDIYINTRSKFNQLWIELNNTSKIIGKELADKLIKKIYGKRVISLFGYSFGSLVIIHCLIQLYNLGHIGRGIVSNVVLLGTPFELNTDIMSNISVVISGKIYNCYSNNDWALAYGCKDIYGKGKIMGLQEINFNGIVNIDLSELIIDHVDYKNKLESICRFISRNMM